MGGAGGRFGLAQRPAAIPDQVHRPHARGVNRGHAVDRVHVYPRDRRDFPAHRDHIPDQALRQDRVARSAR